MDQYIKKIEANKDRRIMTLSLLREGIKELGRQYDGDRLECEILEYVTVYLYADYGFASWWICNRAYGSRFLKEAQGQLEAGGYPEDAVERAFFDTLVNDVIDYLSCKSQDEFMEMK